MYANEKEVVSSQKWAWIWIAYTGFLFISPLIEPSLNLWAGTIAIFSIFLGIMWGYIRSTDAGHPVRFWMIGATFVLGLATFPWNPGASCLFVYAACFLPFSIASVRRVLALMLTESAIVFLEGFLFRNPVPVPFIHATFHIFWPNTLIAIFLMLVIGGGNIFFAEQKRADCRLRAAEERNVALAAVAERERIARDLHDVLGHTLSVITLKAELAGRLITVDPARATAEIADVERLARTSLAEVREAITGYRAQGLAAEIEAARKTLDSAGVTLVLDNEPPNAAQASNNTPSIAVGLNAAEETVLALALREAVTNIVRHARATTCTLRFVSDSGVRRLVVEDNGQHPVTREGNGLRGMRERIESIGGQLRLERGVSSTADGTRLLITLPLHTENA